MLRESLKRTLAIRKNSRSVVVSLLLSLMCGCGVFSTYCETYDFSGGVWAKGDVIAFDFTPIKNSGEPRSAITLALLYDKEYEGTEFMLYVEARASGGLSHTDSLCVELCGSGVGVYKSVEIMWRDNIDWVDQDVSLRIGAGSEVVGIRSLSVEVSGAKNK